MKTRKLISLLLALMMFVSVVPFYASAAEPIALTEANVTVWPTASGEIWFGQKINEGVTLIGGEVQYDGTVVAGRFEFIDSDIYPTCGGINIAALKFIPENFDSYTGFEIEYAWDVLYNVNPVTPVLVDENAPPVATEVEAGARLSTSTISGAAIKNPITNEIITDVVWNWESSRTKVNESGYYPARATVPSSNGGYNPLTVNIYVRIAGDIPETAIAEYPTVPELTYNPNVTWADIELTGGKAVIKGTETEVEGTFAIKNLTAVPNAKSTELTIVFTPANAEEALPYEFTIPVKVNPLPISFGEDLKGTSIDDPFVYEVAPGTTVRDAFRKGYLNYPTPSVVGIEDANSYVENGKVYKVTVLNYTNTNYTGSEAYVKFVFKDVEFAVSSVSYYAATEEINVKLNSNKPDGTFDVFIDGKLVGDDVKRGNDHIDVSYAPETSGTHTVKVVYNPTENDYFFMADYETEIQANVERHITLKNMDIAQKVSVNGKEDYPSSAYILYGDEISIKYGFEDLFVSWVITDTAGKAVDLGVDLTSSEISFTMPDHDLVFAVKTTTQLEQEEAIANCDHLCHSDNELIRLFWNIICMFFRLLNVQQYCDCGELHYNAPLFDFGT